MQYVLFFIILLFYLYRAFSGAQKKAKQEAEQRRRANEQNPQPPSAPTQQKTLQEVLTEVFRETEMKTKPFGDGRTIPPVVQSKKTFEKKPVVQKPVTTYSQTTYSSKNQPQKKKETKPFLTSDYTAETIDPEGTPSAMSKDYIQQTQVADAYLLKEQGSVRYKFDIRNAVIAKIILDRPEW